MLRQKESRHTESADEAVCLERERRRVKVPITEWQGAMASVDLDYEVGGRIGLQPTSSGTRLVDCCSDRRCRAWRVRRWRCLRRSRPNGSC